MDETKAILPKYGSGDAKAEAVELISALNQNMVSALKQLEGNDHALTLPARILLILGTAMILLAVVLRLIPIAGIKFPDFVALLGSAVAVEILGSSLYFYQYRAERIKAPGEQPNYDAVHTIVSGTAQVTERLVATTFGANSASRLPGQSTPMPFETPGDQT
jgi:hypothetical protein